MKVAIIAGGLAHERDVSIRSGRRVAETLRDQEFEVLTLDLDGNLIANLAQFQPDVVWPLVHGPEGEDGSLQDLISLLGYACVGANGARARVASHKPTAKALFASQDVPTPAWFTLTQSLFRQVGARGVLDAIVSELGLPLVVKPADGGSALGVTVVREAAHLPAAMVNCFSYGDQALIEAYVQGTDIAASVVDLGDGPCVLPLVEIVTEGDYDFDARYNPGRSEYFVPARLAPEKSAQVVELVRQIHTSFGLGELSRVDLMVDDAGTPWVLDVNVAPGMTETSLLPLAATSEGPELYAQIVRATAERDGS